ncbi:MAG: sugar ABC transporter permease [Candidatus Methanomethyliaceae archaeon]
MRIRKLRQDLLVMYLYLSPSILLVFLLGILPIIYSVYLSFTNTILSKKPPYDFVGIRNYIHIITDKIFLTSLWKTIYYSGIVIPGVIFLGLFVSLLLTQKFHGKNFVLACLLIPWAIPKVVNGLIWKWIFDGNFGIVNIILQRLGFIKEFKHWFMESPALSLGIMGLITIWKEFPFVTIILLAALQTIDKEIYEAAHLDGAGPIARLVHITLPNIRGALLTVLLLTTIWCVKTFDLVAVLTQGGPGDQTMLTYYYIYILSFDYLNVGRGAAAAYFVTVFLLLSAIVYYRLLVKARA